MSHREHEFTEWRTATIFCGTYNVNAKVIADEDVRALESWLFAESEKNADIYAVVSLLLTRHRRPVLWRRAPVDRARWGFP